MEIEAIVRGEYIYCAAEPEAERVGEFQSRIGHRYRFVRMVRYIPHGQPLCLVTGLTGPDAGVIFVCTKAKFANLFVPAPSPNRETVLETAAT